MLPSCQAASSPEPEKYLVQRMNNLSVFLCTSQSYLMTAGREGTGVQGNLFNEHQGIFPFTVFSLL